MPRVNFSAASLEDLERLREFLQGKSPEAWDKAKAQIKSGIGSLSTQAGMHKGVPDRPRQHDLIIRFGVRSYIARYDFDRDNDQVVILRIRHSRERGF